MTDCRSHGLGDCPQHATSGIGLLRRQYDEMVSENARLTALLAERDAEIARLVELGERMRLAAMYYAANGGDVLCIEFHAACEAWRAALAARGGAVQG